MPSTDRGVAATISDAAPIGDAVPISDSVPITRSEPDTHRLDVDGASIVYLRYAPELPVEVVMVHGFSGHGGWWDAVATELSHSRGVVSVELSGHGDSGHRDEYSMQIWAAEMAAVIREVAGGRDGSGAGDVGPSIIAHSVGGMVSAIAVAELGDAVRQLVMVDTVLKAPRVVPKDRWSNSPTKKVFPELATAINKYRLMPSEPADPAVLRMLAERAVAQVDGGWEWKLDPRIFGSLAPFDPAETFAKISVPVTVVRGEFSPLVDSDVGEHASLLLGRPVPQYDIAGAYHHIPVSHVEPLTQVLLEILDGAAPDDMADAAMDVDDQAIRRHAGRVTG